MCQVRAIIEGSAGYAEVRLYSPFAVPYVSIAGGSRYNGGHAVYYYESISAEQLAECLVTSPSNITDLTQNGADGEFETDDYIGFKFTLLENAGYLEAGTYEYKVTGEVVLDTTPPTASISELTEVGDGTYSADITLSESSTDFDLNDLIITNASAKLTGQYFNYIVY